VTILRIVFLASFIGGLLIAVFAMLHGVEHARRNRSKAPSPFFNLPAIAAFAVGFGAAGYPLVSRTRLPSWATLVISIASGALAISGMITLLARWALRGADPSSARSDEIQGQLAVVTQDIAPGSAGEIAYEHLGKQLRIPAFAMSERPLSVGAEVVIDRIESGIAFVEEWSVVEQRL
jgi:membrane protein implicated in regulation of membrane protease activity